MSTDETEHDRLKLSSKGDLDNRKMELYTRGSNASIRIPNQKGSRAFTAYNHILEQGAREKRSIYKRE